MRLPAASAARASDLLRCRGHAPASAPVDGVRVSVPAAPCRPAAAPAAARRLTVPATRHAGRSSASRGLGAGPGGGPADPGPRSGQRGAHGPAGAGEQAVLRQLRAPVGRGRDGRPGPHRGFLPQLRNPLLVPPEAGARELVGGQYEVLGCLAHGGLGWIYLARDRNVSDSWRGPQGPAQHRGRRRQAAAVAERRFLAEVDHPASSGSTTSCSTGPAHEGGRRVHRHGVRGRAVAQADLARKSARPGRSALPLAQALAYAIEVLPALGYLHSLGLVYCDFKPDNVIQTEEQLKLIDMGGVRRIDDEDSPIYGTVGYQAPEIATAGPSPSSDLYTVGRALAVLTFEFTGYTTTYKHSLPDPAKVPLLAQQESFYRLLRRATDADPLRRFAAAADMAEQLTGVLREVLAVGDGSPRPAFSTRSVRSCRRSVPRRRGWARARCRLAAPPAAAIVAGLPGAAGGRRRPGGRLPGHAEHARSWPARTRAAPPRRASRGHRLAVAESAETRLALARAGIVSRRSGRCRDRRWTNWSRGDPRTGVPPGTRG